MQNTTTKILTLPLRFAIIILIFGALSKVMYWPFSTQLMGIGSCSILILYTIRIFYKKDKVSLDFIKLGLVVLWVISYANQVLHLFNLPYYFEIVLLILFVWWFIQEGLFFFSKRKPKGNIVLTILGLFFGTMFKIQHWPYGALIFTIGMLFLCLIIIVDYFVVEKT